MVICGIIKNDTKDEFAKKIAQNYSNFPWEKYVKKNFANFAKISSEANE